MALSKGKRKGPMALYHYPTSQRHAIKSPKKLEIYHYVKAGAVLEKLLCVYRQVAKHQDAQTLTGPETLDDLVHPIKAVTVLKMWFCIVFGRGQMAKAILVKSETDHFSETNNTK